MNKKKTTEEQFVESIINHISSMNITEEKKKEYTKKILRYMRLKADYYQMAGIDISLGTLIIGMGIGTTVSDSNSVYLPFILGGLGTASIVVTSIKRKIKYKDAMNTLIKKELRNTEINI